MNPDLQKQLAEMLAELTDATTSAATWASGQLPSLVQEKIAFGRAWETWSVLGCAVACVVAFRLALFFNRKMNEERYDDEGWLALCVVSWIATCILAIGAVVNMRDCFLVWFAPRLYIVEWLKSMVTK